MRTLTDRIRLDFGKVHYEPIGYVESGFAHYLPKALLEVSDQSRIMLDPIYAEGLDGLKPGMRIDVLFHCHLSGDYTLKQRPGDDPKARERGVFAVRSARRPNPIGLTQVEILAVGDHVLWVKGIDAVDGTPVLDIKPALIEEQSRILRHE